jgi:hypothetical protein
MKPRATRASRSRLFRVFKPVMRFVMLRAYQEKTDRLIPIVHLSPMPELQAETSE